MSVQTGANSVLGSTFSSRHSFQPPTLDQLKQKEQTLQAAGKDTSNLDKIIANFDQLSTNGKLDFGKLKQDASQLEIQLPASKSYHPHKNGKAHGPGKGQQGPQQAPPPSPTLDQLKQQAQTLQAAGKDTTNLNKLINNFDQLSTNGKLDPQKVEANAQQLGIELPPPPPSSGHHHGHSGQNQGSSGNTPPLQPPPGLDALG